MSHNNHNGDEMLITHPYYRGSYSNARLSICPAYCDCDFPATTAVTCFKGHIPDLIKCRCGEDDPATHALHWNWHQCSGTDTVINGPDITFHPTYSQGTAIVRGEKPLAPGMMHFWEMRILTALSGTDVMFGIGTDKVDLTQFKFHYLSALGSNSQSWGFSYEGKIHHFGMQSKYGQKFSQGCIVGVLLDRVRGQLEFFLNRRSLGVAYTNIPNDPSIKIYPMVCSTAAKSCIRLINANSQVESLQLEAFKALAEQPKALEELRKLPGLKPILNDYWFLAPPVRYSRENKSNMFGIGTDKVDLTQFKFHFISALGTNSQSWGFSYEGKIHHVGMQSKYGQKFSQGCIVGVLLDRVRGQLEFFLNRRSLGVAYTNIPNDPSIKIYPMVCSTAAKSCIRLMNANSQVESLQLEAFRALAKQPKALEELRKLPGLKTILNDYWFLAPPVRYSRESKSNVYDMLDEAVLSSKSRLSRKHKYKDDETDDLNDLYSSAHKICVHRQNDSDDELALNDYFDEYFHYLF